MVCFVMREITPKPVSNAKSQEINWRFVVSVSREYEGAFHRIYLLKSEPMHRPETVS